MMFSDQEKAFNHCWNSYGCQSSVTPRGWFYRGWDAALKKQGEDKVKISKLQQDLDQWAKTGTAYFDEIVALKRERTKLKNERDTWKARHQTLKSAIGKATQTSNLDGATYG